MSSINSATDRSGNEDSLRRTQETYKNREAEENKKHSQELRQVNEVHAEEVERLKEDHTKELEALKERTREAISGRDMKYQKEIDDLRDFHQKQLSRTMQDAEGRERTSEKALREEMGRQSATSDLQKKQMRSAYEDQIRKKDRAAEVQNESARGIQNQSAAALRTRLNQAHENELGAVVKDRDDRISAQKSEMDEYRRTKESTLDQLERQHASERDRLLAEHTNSLQNMQEDQKQSNQTQRTVFDQGLAKNRERYNKALRENGDEGQRARENLAETVESRYGSRLRQAQTDLQNLRAEATRTATKDERQKALEVANVRGAMQANVEQLEKDRIGSVEASNKRNQKVISKLASEKDDQLAKTHHFYQEKLADSAERGEVRVNTKEADLTKAFSHEKATANVRTERLKTSNELEQAKMRSFFEKATSAQRENFEQNLRELRERNRIDHEQIFSTVSKQAQENDAKFQSKLGDLATKYDRLIADMQDKHQKELKDQQTLAERQRHELEKKSQTDISSQMAQTDYKMSKMEETHQREIKSLQAKHEESLANLTRNRQG